MDIEFILGERKNIDFIVESTEPNGVVIIESATWQLKDVGEVLQSGECDIVNNDASAKISALIEPQSTGRFVIEVSYIIADESRKVRGYIKVD